MEGLDLGQTSNPSLAWKNDVLKINDDDDDDDLQQERQYQPKTRAAACH